MQEWKRARRTQVGHQGCSYRSPNQNYLRDKLLAFYFLQIMSQITNALRRQPPEVLAAGALVGVAFALARIAEEPERARRKRRQDEGQCCIAFIIIVVALIANAMWPRALEPADTADPRTCLLWETRVATRWDDIDQKMGPLSSALLDLDVFLCQTVPGDACIPGMGSRRTVGELLAWGLARLSHFDASHQSHVEMGKGDIDSALLTKMRAVSHMLASLIRSASGGSTLATAHRVIDECYGWAIPSPQPKGKRKHEQETSKPALHLRCFYDNVRDSGGWTNVTLAAVATCATRWASSTCSAPLPLQPWADGNNILTREQGVRSTCPWSGAAEMVYWSKSLDMGTLVRQMQAWRDAVLVATAATSAPHQPAVLTARPQERQQEVPQKQFLLRHLHTTRLVSILQSYGKLQRQSQPIRGGMRWLGHTLMSYMHWSHPCLAGIAVPAFLPVIAVNMLLGEPGPDPVALLFLGVCLLVALFCLCAPILLLLLLIGFYVFAFVALAEVYVYSIGFVLVLLAGSDPVPAEVISVCIELLSPHSDSVTSMPAECVALFNGAFTASFEAFQV